MPSFGDFVLDNPITSFVAIFALVTALLVGYFFVLHKEDSESSTHGSELFKGLNESAGAKLDEDWTDLDFRTHNETDSNGLAPSQDVVGGQTDRYSWTQSKQEVDVFVPISAAIKKQEIVCKFTGSNLSLSVAGVEIINGPLFSEVDTAECNWQIGVYMLFCTHIMHFE